MNRLLPLLLLAALALPAVASAEPALDGQFPVDAKPEELVQGPDGNVWFLMGSELGRITPDGTVSDDFAIGATGTDIAASPTRLWIARSGGVVEVDPATPDAPVDHPVVQIGNAQGIALEGDGDLWVVEDDGLVEVGADGGFKREIPG